MSEYVVAIPSYQRADTLGKRTLQLLQAGKVPLARVRVFVANAAERDAYAAALPKGVTIVVGVKGIAAQRDFIRRYFPLGAAVVSIDDDFTRIRRLGPNGKLEDVSDLHAMFKACFAELRRRKLTLWGLYPVDNTMFMSKLPAVTTDLRFVDGALNGFLNEHYPATRVREKEDVLLTLRAYTRHGGVLRFNHMTYNVSRFSKGGLGPDTPQRRDNNRKAAEYIHHQFPTLTRIQLRKDGRYEIKLVTPRHQTREQTRELVEDKRKKRTKVAQWLPSQLPTQA